MKKALCLLIVMMFAAAPVSASSIAGKIWYADLTGNDAALLYGGSMSLSLGETLWLSGLFLTGTYEDIDGVVGIDYDTKDAEIILGLTFNILDIGIGARYSEWTFTDGVDEVDLAIFGPMAYVGIGDLIGDLPFGWYVGASYVFKDLGDADDYDFIDNFEHYNIEGGLSMSFDPLTATLGYRVKKYVNYSDLTFKGVTASLGFGF